MNDKGQALAEFLNALVKRSDLQPKPDGTTFCNIASQFVAQFFGCKDFNDSILAEAMIEFMEANPDRWKAVDGEPAASFALAGCLVFAAMTAEDLGEAHAHIAAVYPAQTQFSGSLRKTVPMLANCGKTNGIMRASQAFPVAKGEPKYYSWCGINSSNTL